jgi:hypothetical protein
MYFDGDTAGDTGFFATSKKLLGKPKGKGTEAGRRISEVISIL